MKPIYKEEFVPLAPSGERLSLAVLGQRPETINYRDHGTINYCDHAHLSLSSVIDGLGHRSDQVLRCRPLSFHQEA